MKSIINLDALTFQHYKHGDKFETLDSPIGPVVGARQLGYSFNIVPPGKRAWPFHCHHVNEEMFFIIEGSGIVRIGDREYPIRKGDVIAAPPGGRDTAHQIVNTSNEDLRYLSVSTMLPTEVVEYPDANKIMVRVDGAQGSAPGAPDAHSFHFLGRMGPGLDYWEGE